jgi:aspartyl aminopeptidase
MPISAYARRLSAPALRARTRTIFSRRLSRHTLAREMMDFLDASPDPFHACHTLATKMASAGFSEIDEREPWRGRLGRGGKYFFTRNDSCIVAFSVGGKYEVGGGGFKVLGAHLDSPNLRVKPVSKRPGSSGTLQLGVECYGGGMWHTWFDRDLAVAGRAIVRADDGSTQARLVRLPTPLLRVPSVAIHLQTAKEREAFEVNKQDHLQPILALATKDALTGSAEPGCGGGGAGWEGAQEPLLVRLVADALGVAPAQVAEHSIA